MKKYTEEALKGKKFGALTYIKHSHRTKESTLYCIWKCACGQEISASAYSVVHGRKKSCNCYLFKCRDNNAQWKGYKEITGSRWCEIKKCAKKRNLPFKIDIKYVWDLFIKQDKKCALSGVPIKFDTSWKLSDGTASLDRIDNMKGYTINNVQWTHKWVNIMKMDLSEGEFFDWCKKIVEYQHLIKR